MKVLENFLRAKSGDPSQCEDAIVHTEHFVAVLDGATDKTGQMYEGRLGGRYAVDVLGTATESLEPELAAHEAVGRLTAALATAISLVPGTPHEYDTPSASAAIFSQHRSEIWRVGDVAYRTGPRSHYGRKRIDQATAAVRSAYLQSLLRGGASQTELEREDPGRALILPLLERQYEFANIYDPRCQYAFGSLDGHDVPASFIEVVEVPRGVEIVFASDGYPRIFASLEASEAYLQADLRRDPLRIWRHPATKGVRHGHESFDDRAWLRFVTE